MNSRTKTSVIILALSVATVALMLSVSVKSQTIDEGKTKIKKPETCTELTDPDGWQVSVWRPGHYCIGQDLYQSWPLFEFPHQRVPRSPLIGIYSDGATIDLKGHHLKNKTPIHSGVFTNFSGGEAISPTIIKNGRITTINTPAAHMVDNWNLGNQRFGRNYPLSSSNGDISKYKPTSFVLENLTLEGDQHTIIMQGKNNIIRNCTIIGGNGTVNVYGPNLQFEDNTIILTSKTPKDPDSEQPVALYLEDSADSVVRNNKIIIKGSGALNSNAVVLVNSPNVLLEHNTIRGTKTVYKLLDQRSSVKELANDAK
jgi:hypothetical protein